MVNIAGRMNRYCLPNGYTSRLEPAYFVEENYEGTWQPDVYPEAADLATRLAARAIVDVGCGTASKLAALHPNFEIVGIDHGYNIEACRRRYDFGTWLDVDLDRADSLGISDFRATAIICADVIEHLVYPEKLLRLLANALDEGALALVLSTPDRELINGPGHLGPPVNPAHVREWTGDELERFLTESGLPGHFGRTRSNDIVPALRTILAVIPGRSPLQRDTVGEWFEERRRWQRVPEGQDRSFAKYEAWVRELEAQNDWLTRRYEAQQRWLDSASSVISHVRSALSRITLRRT